MPAPTIVSHSFATATNDTTITIPAPAGLEEHHSLVCFLAAEMAQVSSPPNEMPTGWSGPATEDQVGVGAVQLTGFGCYIAYSYTLDYVGTVEADYTFQLLTTAGFGGTPPANTTPFVTAHGHLLALDRGLDGSIAAGQSDSVYFGAVDFGAAADLEAPPSLMLNFLSNAAGPSAAFGTMVSDEGFTKIGYVDTTGMTAGDNLGARTVTSSGATYGYANWSQLEEVFGTPVEPLPTSVAAWGVLAR